MAKTFVLANQKGGVGKTTTAVNVATGIAQFGKKVLLVDLDPQGNATSGLGIDRGELHASVYECIMNRIPIEEIIVPTITQGLEVLPSLPDLTGAEVELVEVKDREKVLKKLLEELKNRYECIIIDCPPSLNLLTINALSAADYVIMPIQCEYYALEGMSMLTNTIRLVQKNLNPHLEIAGIVMTMADMRTSLTKQVISEVKKHFDGLVYEAVIPRNIRISESPSFGKSIIQYDIRSVGAEGYLTLAAEIIEKHLT